MKWRYPGVLASIAVAASIISGGCAKAPAGTGTGPRLAVTLRFSQPVKPEYYYYILIRNAPDSEQTNPRNWPVPVLAAGGGNGFATDAHTNSGTAAFTDFVLFGGGALAHATTSGYAHYHVVGYLHGNVNTPGSFRLVGNPDTTSGSDPYTLSFELSLSSLRADAGECDSTVAGDCPTAKYLNINVVATTELSFDPQNPDPRKAVDALGDQSTPPASPTFTQVVNIKTAESRIFQSSSSPGDPNYEPDNDAINTAVSSNVDPAIELVAWQFQVKQ